MTDSWNDLLKGESPAEKERRIEGGKNNSKDKYLTREFYSYEEWGIGGNPWNYERQKLYKLIGMVRLKTKTNSHTYKTGNYYLERTSNSRYDIKEETRSYNTKTYIVGIEKSKILDVDKYLEILKEVDELIEQGRTKFEKGVSPSTFNPIIRLCTKWPEILLVSAFVITIPFYAAYLVWDHLTYRERHSESLSWVEAYNEKVKQIEMKAKNITLLEQDITP